MVVMLFLIAGCAGSGGASSTGAIRPIGSRVDAIPGAVLVVPVEIRGVFDPETLPAVRLEDGRQLDASFHWIGVRSRPLDLPARTWLAPPGEWATAPASAGLLPGERGTWSLVAPMPLDAVGQAMWIGRVRVPLTWLPNPSGFGDLIQAGALGTEQVWDRPVDDSILSMPGVTQRLAPARLSPDRRWRARLLTDGLRPRDEPFSPGLAGLAEAADSFSDPVLEAFARWEEDRWSVAFARLWQASPPVADELKRVLGRISELPGGARVPTWPVDGPMLRALREALTDPSASERSRIAVAQAFIETQQPASAWVIDESGGAAGDEVTVATLNLGARPTLTWVEGAGDSGRTGLEVLERDASRAIGAALPLKGPAGERFVTAHAGEWVRALAVRAEPVSAAPPGARLGPFLLDLDLAGVLDGGAGSRPRDEWQTAALVYHDEGSGAGAWIVYVECNRLPIVQEAGSRTPPESLRISFGERGNGGVVRISEDGSVITEGAARDRVIDAEVTDSADRWTARVPIPSALLESAGDSLRLGIERTDRLGRRSAWPRPMLPWQPDPGRLVIDLNTWR